MRLEPPSSRVGIAIDVRGASYSHDAYTKPNASKVSG